MYKHRSNKMGRRGSTRFSFVQHCKGRGKNQQRTAIPKTPSSTHLREKLTKKKQSPEQGDVAKAKEYDRRATRWWRRRRWWQRSRHRSKAPPPSISASEQCRCVPQKVQLPSSAAPCTYESEGQRFWKNSALLPCVTRIRYQVCVFFFSCFIEWVTEGRGVVREGRGQGTREVCGGENKVVQGRRETSLSRLQLDDTPGKGRGHKGRRLKERPQFLDECGRLERRNKLRGNRTITSGTGRGGKGGGG